MTQPKPTPITPSRRLVLDNLSAIRSEQSRLYHLALRGELAPDALSKFGYMLAQLRVTLEAEREISNLAAGGNVIVDQNGKIVVQRGEDGILRGSDNQTLITSFVVAPVRAGDAFLPGDRVVTREEAQQFYAWHRSQQGDTSTPATAAHVEQFFADRPVPERDVEFERAQDLIAQQTLQIAALTRELEQLKLEITAQEGGAVIPFRRPMVVS